MTETVEQEIAEAAPAKVSKPRKTRAASKPRKSKAAKPARASKAALCIKLASRPKGATAAELDKATGWVRAAWGWLFSNRTGNGFAQRRGLKFKSKVVDGTARYFVTGGR